MTAPLRGWSLRCRLLHPCAGYSVDELSRAEQVRRFVLLPAEWTAETGELTPTLKRRRRVIAERYAGEIERLYGPADPGVTDVEATS